MDCGNICEAFPITDLSSLRLYSSQKCTLIAGDLHIAYLSSLVHEDILFDNLKQVVFLRGSLFVHDNQFLSSLVFFRNVTAVNNVSLSNNPNLVDARMPSLQNMAGQLDVIACNRLCPERYTVVGPSPNDTGCANLVRLAFLSIGGSYDLSVAYTVSILVNAMTFFSNGTVCFHGLIRSFFGDIASYFSWLVFSYLPCVHV
jgi:hypothetical protein